MLVKVQTLACQGRKALAFYLFFLKNILRAIFNQKYLKELN